MKLNTILTSGSWVEIADLLNDNFSKIAIAIDLGIDGDGGGGITIYDVEKYLEQYKYTTQDDVSAMLSPYVLKREVTPVITDLNTRVASIEMYFSTEEESDNTINKWNEIVAFLDGIKGDTLDNILVTKADKATTLAGYGITDAYTKAEANGKYLPLSGGTLTGRLEVHNRIATTDILELNMSDGTFGLFLAPIQKMAGYSTPNLGIYDSKSWHEVLHSGNYSNYVLPKDGTAVAATKLATPRTIWGKNFDGSVDIGGDIQISKGDRIMAIDGDVRRSLISFTSANKVTFGYSATPEGYETMIYGNTILFRYGKDVGTAMVISPNGNVGIGTGTPSARLEVNGHIKASSVNDYEERIAALEEKTKNL